VRILIIGTGGREHALARKLALEGHEVHAAPGNPGIGAVATLHDLVDPLNGPDVAALATRVAAELVVVGPEAPLVAGVADVVAAAGIPVFGPSQAAAQLEGSKAFSKQVMAAAGVPTARSHTCASVEEVAAALADFGTPYVVKDDGLAAGKGVVVTTDRDAALAHAASCLDGGAGRVVVEEYLDGPEVSLFAVCGYDADGVGAFPLQPAQDFKRILDGDEGGNTGGMGSYTPLAWAPDDMVHRVMTEVVLPTLEDMHDRGTPFAGLLFVGLAITEDGPRVIEFNARFGDPETQSLLAVMASDLAPVLFASATGTLPAAPAPTFTGHACTVVLASAGYPESSSTGDVITGVEEAEAIPGVHVIHAGTALSASGDLVTAGGRVLAVVGTGASLEEARTAAYDGVGTIHFAGAQHRSDIALKAVTGAI
jgi:phosphoribosylamine---glycine ligase